MVFLSSDDGRPTSFRKGTMVKAAGGAVAAVLRPLLGDVYAMLIQAQGAHWNVKGADFSQYHALFGSIYDDVYSSIDPLAENILKLGAEAPCCMSEMQQARTTVDKVHGSDPVALAKALAEVNDDVLSRITTAFGVANAANEQGIANFLAERMDMHQKWRWQLKSSVGEPVA